ncbi:Type II toxin-antitoxin system ParD family antitoxin [Sulfidibacter corallicola]|uniref:Type II toxin-antitoxin system ParD family antitoxin n=1 Tax=Sulfidibacter corallicola TaxID=2818388 RepID=A0A8A4TRY3_SULCO|nr:type II toxin-antitoxin system ParD family antitoxin [Sulfidibacter corallicola]QTD51924.1 type II toxin-antitoxin system ParD family antitoxin [Sulfidibacter corallicola]
MHISLTPELEKLIQSKVETGLYNNPSEVICEALRFMEQNQDQVHYMKLNTLRSLLADGERQIAENEGTLLHDTLGIQKFFEHIKGQ